MIKIVNKTKILLMTLGKLYSEPRPGKLTAYPGY